MAAASSQLSFLVADQGTDLAWMRERISKLKLSEVTDHHLIIFWRHANGDRKMAALAIESIHAGRKYQPLRDLIESRRSP